MEKKEKSLTSVKIHTELFDSFRLECVKRKFNLDKLVNRAVHLYLNSEEFRKTITNYNMK